MVAVVDELGGIGCGVVTAAAFPKSVEALVSMVTPTFNVPIPAPATLHVETPGIEASEDASSSTPAFSAIFIPVLL